MAAAKKRIGELETELMVALRAVEVIAAAELPVQFACRVLGVSESGF